MVWRAPHRSKITRRDPLYKDLPLWGGAMPGREKV